MCAVGVCDRLNVVVYHLSRTGPVDASMTRQDSTRRRPHWTDNLRSIVRPVVTILVILVLLGLYAHTIVFLLATGEEVKSALALLSGLAALASGIIGFWFGTRGSGGVVLPSGESSADSAAYGGHGIVLVTPLGAAEIVQMRHDALIPVRARSPGPPAREFHGNAAAASDGTLLFHFMDEYVDGRRVQLPESISASMPAGTQSVAAGTRLFP